MILNLHLYVAILIGQLSLITSITSHCEIGPVFSNCEYTVTCDQRGGGVSNPHCSYSHNVTFIMKNSKSIGLEYIFFGSTNFDSRVRTFIATNNSWTSLEREAFRYYSGCNCMRLSNNKIETIKNGAFLLLSRLKELTLSHNYISAITTDTFIITNGDGNLLTFLDLSFNKLNSLPSGVFKEIPNLTELYLDNNIIKTIEDDSLNNLNKLSVLSMSHNKLSSLNMTLINLKSLKRLEISNNYFVKISGYEINRLIALKYINMSHNAIETIDSNCFSSTFDLEYVDLRYNKIKSPIETVMFMNNKKLHYVDFFDNKISVINENAFKNNILSVLDLGQNNLSMEITKGILVGLSKIEKLDLNSQHVTMIKNLAFSEMNALKYLKLSYNNITIIEPTGFFNANAIIILELIYNNITDLSFLKNSLVNLEELYLSNNNIKYIPKDTFMNQTVLKMLDISNNKITYIDQYALSLTSLQFLKIHGNQVIGILKSNIFSPGRYLRSLNLSHFRLTSVDNMAFSNLPVLARLNLSNNEIENIDPNNFQNMNNMYSLDLSHNLIKYLDLRNSTMNNLKALYLNNNRLRNISTLFSHVSNISFIDISYNNITSLYGLGLNMTPKLQKLHMSNNKINDFNDPQTNILTSLIDLNLSSNRISNINLSFFNQLQIVDLSNNNFTKINHTFFDNLSDLQVIDLSFNKITELLPGAFQNARALKILNISNNFIKTLRYGFLKGLHDIEILDLSNNNIKELDVNMFHNCNNMLKLIIDYNRISTLDVDRLIMVTPKLNTISLGGNPISCKEIVQHINYEKSRPRLVVLISIDKIYHDDNVNGIKCGYGDEINITVTTDKVVNADPTKSHTEGISPTIIVLLWCLGLTVLLVIFITVYYFMKRNRFSITDSNIVPLRSNSTLSTDFNHDLLG